MNQNSVVKNLKFMKNCSTRLFTKLKLPKKSLYLNKYAITF